MFVKITDKKGRPIDDLNGLAVKLVDANGNELVVTPDGKLQIDVSAVTASSMKLEDGTDGNKKLAIDSDGAASMKLTGSLGKELVYVKSINAYTAGEVKDNIINTTDPIIIDKLDWAPRDEDEAFITITLYNKDGGTQLLETIDELSTGAYVSFSAKRIKDTSDNFFEILRYDTANQIFRFKLREPLICPFGLKIRGENTSASSIRNSLIVVGRKI